MKSWSRPSDPATTLKHIIRTITQIVAGGVIRAGQKQSWGDDLPGIWLGVDSQDQPKMDIGTDATHMRWSPETGLTLKATLKLTTPNKIETGDGDARMDADGFTVMAGTGSANKYKGEYAQSTVLELYPDTDPNWGTEAHLIARGANPQAPEAILSLIAITHNGQPAAGEPSASLELDTEAGRVRARPRLSTPRLEAHALPAHNREPLYARQSNPAQPLLHLHGDTGGNTASIVSAAQYPNPGAITLWLRIRVTANQTDYYLYLPCYTAPT